jgi:hypothetical protein
VPWGVDVFPNTRQTGKNVKNFHSPIQKNNSGLCEEESVRGENTCQAGEWIFLFAHKT